MAHGRHYFFTLTEAGFFVTISSAFEASGKELVALAKFLSLPASLPGFITQALEAKGCTKRVPRR